MNKTEKKDDWRERLLRHETLHTGNCYCEFDTVCNFMERLEGFIEELLQATRNAMLEEVEAAIPSASMLHQYYLDATRALKPESYNPDAQKSFEELTDEQKSIDQYIVDRILLHLSTLKQNNLTSNKE